MRAERQHHPLPSGPMSLLPSGRHRSSIADNRSQAISQAALIHTIQESTGAVAQRMCGFEAEFPVPTMEKDGLPGFMAGGMKYATELGKSSDFKMVTDHGCFQNIHRQLVEAVNSKQGNASTPFKNISNLEYVTDPIDEFAAGSDERFHQQFVGIQHHAENLISFAKNRTGSIPETSSFTGLPVTELIEILGEDAKPLLTAYQEMIKPEFYIQATVGIIPSSLSDLWKEEKDGNVIFPDLMKNTRDIASELIAQSWFQEGMLDFTEVDSPPDTSSITQVRHLKGGPYQAAYDSLIGQIYMITSYGIGAICHKIRQAKPDKSPDTTKNLVPFMLKTGWEHLDTAILSNSLKLNIALFLSEKIPEEKIDNGFFMGNLFFSFVLDALNGDPSTTTLASPVSGRRFPEPDDMPDQIGQPGIQVEYRHIKVRPTPGELPDTLMAIVQDVRAMNSKYLPQGGEKEADKPPG